MNSTPDISALMSAFNSGPYINQTLDSILNQTFQNFELIIVDDASSDNTVELIEQYSDPRIKLYKLTENVGVGSALKYGLSKTTGRYIAKVDSDDIYLPERFAKQKEYLDSNPSIALVKTLIDFFPDDEKVANSTRYQTIKNVREAQYNSVVSSDDIAKKIRWWFCIPHNSIMVRAEAIKRVGYIETRICEDFHLFYTMNKLGYRMATIEEPLTKCRVRDSSITGTTSFQKEWVETIARMKQDEMNAFLNEDNRDIFIWGCGSLGQNLLQTLGEKSLKISGFLDNNKELHGKTILGKVVCDPSIIKSQSSKFKIIIAAQPIREQIMDYLETRGYTEKDYFIF